MVDLPRCRTVQICAADELRISHPVCGTYLCPDLHVPDTRLDGIANPGSFHWHLCSSVDDLLNSYRTNDACRALNQTMRYLAKALILLGILWCVFSSIDELDGSVTVYSRHSAPKTYTRIESPEEFRHAMNFYWIKCPLPALAGLLLLWFIRRQDRLDPSSPHFQGSQALDDLGEYLDRELEKKSKGQNRHRS